MTYDIFEKKIKQAFQRDKFDDFIYQCLMYYINFQHIFPLIDISLSSTEDNTIKEMYMEYFSHHLEEYVTKKEGYVYIAAYPMLNHKDVYKVGFTKNVNSRLKSLNNASVMGEIVICESFHCKNASLAESITHKALHQYQADKEFYQLDYNAIKQVIQNVVSTINKGLTIHA